MKRRALLALCTLIAFAGLVACDAGDVPVFSAASAGTAGNAGTAGSAGALSGAGGSSGADTGSGGTYAGQGGDISAGGGDTVCHGNGDCPDASFCLTQSCDHGAPGVCVVRPPICDSTLKLVCGCDKLTYWNDCLRQEYGISWSTEGSCAAGAKTCHGNNDCPGMLGATCAHLLPVNVGCGAMGDQGTCWVTPTDCSMTGDTRVWQSCPPPGSGGGLGPCTSTCGAVKAGHPFIQVDGTACP